MKPLVIIPARGGSKGVPRKNIKKLDGKPLILHTLEAARKVFEDNEICVSTDDPEIKKCVEDIGFHVPFLRPVALSLDTSGTYEVIMHAASYYESRGYRPDTIILLQPTSPFRTETHVREALSQYNRQLDMVVSVKEAKSNPYFVLFEEDQYGYLKKSKENNFERRQDCPTVWEYNGAIYILNFDSLLSGPLYSFSKIKKYVMDEVSSVDIDTELDWMFAEFIIQNNKK